MRDTILIVQETSARSGAVYEPSLDISSVGGAGESHCKWRPMPGELVSLWKMLRFHAHRFVHLLTTIRHWREVYRLGAHYAEAGEVQLDEDSRDFLAKLLDSLKSDCEELDLPLSTKHIDRIESAWSHTRGNEMVNQFGHLEDLIKDELANKLFIVIPTQRARYCPEPVERRRRTSPLFGKAVQNKFPKLTADIVDAGWCLGIERSTAAVYHLMRIMEFGIKRIAKRLKIDKRSVERKTWGQIFSVINKTIAALPYSTAREKDRRDKYSEAMVHLNNVKDAWRNQTMHSGRRFTQEEAEAIFASVKTFINYLTTIV
jgi:hypothetical protein